MLTPDQIVVANLELSAHIGVTEEERSRSQRLTVWLTLTPARSFDHLDDRLENTVNYAAVCKAVRALAAARAPRLLETLAGEIAALILAEFDCAAVEVELRKYILPDTDYVAVRLARPRPANL